MLVGILSLAVIALVGLLVILEQLSIIVFVGSAAMTEVHSRWTPPTITDAIVQPIVFHICIKTRKLFLVGRYSDPKRSHVIQNPLLTLLAHNLLLDDHRP